MLITRVISMETSVFLRYRKVMTLFKDMKKRLKISIIIVTNPIFNNNSKRRKKYLKIFIKIIYYKTLFLIHWSYYFIFFHIKRKWFSKNSILFLFIKHFKQLIRIFKSILAFFEAIRRKMNSQFQKSVYIFFMCMLNIIRTN